jgi:hypothetical protein
MRHTYVRVATDIHAKWTDSPPVYRLFINDELLTERTYIWHEQYLEEHIQLDVAPGKYYLRLEIVRTLPTFKADDLLRATAIKQTLVDFVEEEVMTAEKSYLRRLGVGEEQMEFFLASRLDKINKERDLKYEWYKKQEQETTVWFENTRILQGPATIKSGHLIRVGTDENT